MSYTKWALTNVGGLLALASIGGGIASLVLGTREPRRVWLIILGSILLAAGVFSSMILRGTQIDLGVRKRSDF
jgi:hypothetical protein